ncbi:MAG: ribosomal protein S18-alanine N-acetyltransferase [Acidobacteriota bacterium]
MQRERTAVIVRAAYQSDLPAIAAIQQLTPEAAQWEPATYLDTQCGYACHVALVERRVAGFAVTRRNAPDECELLNVATDPAMRRQGIARALLKAVFSADLGPGSNQAANRWFLEVRESNVSAQALYESLGFERIGRRDRYYTNPRESAIVMLRKS